MEREELLKLIAPANHLQLVYMNNEIFEVFSQNEDLKISKHKAFAYCYYCLITYFYQYGLYKHVTTIKLNIEAIKTILGYPNNCYISYITKKNGVLDKIGYTKSSRNLQGKKLNYEIKYPLKTHTKNHVVDMRTFLHAMKHKKEIGLIGFYLYQFIKLHKQITIAKKAFSVKTGIAETTLDEYLTRLEKYNYVTNSHEPFVINAPLEERKSCTYSANEFEAILNTPKNELITRKIHVYTNEDYYDWKGNFVVTDYNEESEVWG